MQILKNILWGVVEILNAIVHASLLLLLLTGIGSIGFGFPKNFQDCPIQVWLFIFGIFTYIDVCLCVLNICFVKDDIFIAISVCFLAVSFLWLFIGLMCANDRQSLSMSRCEDGVAQTFKTTFLLTILFITSLCLIVSIGCCFNSVLYEKEEEREEEEVEGMNPLNESLI
jgi:hypothetical protein